MHFQKLYYNDMAKMTALVVPLVTFESTEDLNKLSIKTVTAATTIITSDINAGMALSINNQLSIEKLVAVFHSNNGPSEQPAFNNNLPSPSREQPTSSYKLSLRFIDEDIDQSQELNDIAINISRAKFVTH